MAVSFYLTHSAYYDAERQQFIDDCGEFDLQRFEHWRSRLPDIRAYATSSGEVAMYRLRLTLGKVGEAFLTLDRYLASRLVDHPIFSSEGISH